MFLCFSQPMDALRLQLNPIILKEAVTDDMLCDFDFFFFFAFNDLKHVLNHKAALVNCS